MTTTTTQRPSKRKIPQNSPGEDVTICPICLDPILDATEKSVGQKAIFCKSTCNSWIHRQCVGLSQVLFNLFEESEEPFYCLQCCLVSEDKQLQQFKSMVEKLSKEVVSLKTTTVTDCLESSSPPPQQQISQEVRLPLLLLAKKLNQLLTLKQLLLLGSLTTEKPEYRKIVSTM